MPRTLIFAAALILVALIFSTSCSRVVSIDPLAPRTEPNSVSTVDPDPSANADSVDVLIPAAKAKAAPALADGKWINTDPLTADKLRGHVVLLDFWTFFCENCVNTLPTLKGFDKQYRDKGLTIVGIETPELELERSFD